MAKTVFDVLLGRLQEDIESATTHLKAGIPSSFEQYREVCGLIRGLEVAKSHVMELQAHVEADDE